MRISSAVSCYGYFLFLECVVGLLVVHIHGDGDCLVEVGLAVYEVYG